MRKLKVAMLLLFIASPLRAGDGFTDDEIGSGFVSVEGGVTRILGSGRNYVDDAPTFTLNFGFSLSKEFKSETDYEPLKICPKIGVGFGEIRSSAITEAYYDVLLKVRYSLGTRQWPIRPFFDLGPGMITYGERAFQIEGGTGLEFLVGPSFFGLNVQFKEVLGSRFLDRGLQFMGALGWQF